MSISLNRKHEKITTHRSPKPNIPKEIAKKNSNISKIRISNNEDVGPKEAAPVDLHSYSKPYVEPIVRIKVSEARQDNSLAPVAKKEKVDPRIVKVIPVGNDAGISKSYEEKKILPKITYTDTSYKPKLSDFTKPSRIRTVKSNPNPIITAQVVTSQAVLDKRISELQLATDIANEDLLAIVDRSDLTMRSSGTTKAAQISLLAAYFANLLSDSAFVAGPIYSTATASKEVLATISKDATILPIGKILKIIAFGDFAANDNDKKVGIEINDIVLIENTVNAFPSGQAWSLEATVMVIDNGIYACCGTGRVGAVQEYTESFELVDGSDTLNIEVKSTSSASLANQVLLEAFHVVVQ